MKLYGSTREISLDVQDSKIVQDEFTLYQNYPNPFNPSTTITYELESKAFVRLRVIDVLGQEVSSLVNEVQNAGVSSIQFNSRNLASGVYFYLLETVNLSDPRIRFQDIKKMILMR